VGHAACQWLGQTRVMDGKIRMTIGTHELEREQEGLRSARGGRGSSPPDQFDGLPGVVVGEHDGDAARRSRADIDGVEAM
jgi:hypothetical protein